MEDCEEPDTRTSSSQRTLTCFSVIWGLVILIFVCFILYEGLLLQILLNWKGQHQLLSLRNPGHPRRRLGGSNCVRQCGDVEIPFPFGLSERCAINSSFVLECRTNVSGVNPSAGLDEVGTFPFLNNVATGNANGTVAGLDHIQTLYHHTVTSFQVRNITPGSIVIDTSNIKAPSCNGYLTVDSPGQGKADIRLDPDGPYRISNANIVVAVGCHAIVLFEYDGGGGQADGGGGQAICGPTACNNQQFYNFCNYYDCCTLSIQPALNMSLTVAGDCGSGSLLFASSYMSYDPRTMLNATYGIELAWAIPSADPGLCSSDMFQSADYVCSEANVICNNVSLQINPPFNGYYCTCEPGFSGDGYKNGTPCTDIDECSNSTLNDCAEFANCTNLPGSYNCSCQPGYYGNGFSNGTACKDIDECSDQTLNDCLRSATCQNSAGSYDCACAQGYHGDGKKHGTGCKGSNFKEDLAIGLGIGVPLLLLGILGGFCLFRSHRKRKRRMDGMEILQKWQTQGGARVCRLYTLEELKKATGDFDEQNVIGVGGFGKVHKGVLNDHDGKRTEVAVKRAKLDVAGDREAEQFINEVTILSTVNHTNLVKLLGCCADEKVPVLVYEYFVNGSLQDHLKQSRSSAAAQSTDGPPETSLDWDQRLKIAIGSAAALTYLHSETELPIYHRDVKSANILLDKNFVAKVADFGLSKTVPVDADETYLVTNADGDLDRATTRDQTRRMKPRLEGTVGYMVNVLRLGVSLTLFDGYSFMPLLGFQLQFGISTRKEYAFLGSRLLSDSSSETFWSGNYKAASDVYSFGVVLLELLTGDRAFDLSLPGPDQNLAQRCKRLLKLGLFEGAIDPALNASYDRKKLEATHAVAELAVECLDWHQENRPTMREVVDRLRSLSSESITRHPRAPSYSSGPSVDEQIMRQFMSPYTSDDVYDSSSITRGMLTNSEDPLHNSRSDSDSPQIQLSRF